ncbi:MAG: histidine phosphatase family protein [Hyphomonadaceae bacterium]
MDEAKPGSSSDHRLAAAPGWIALARHGKPKGDRSVRINWKDYEHWWAEYDRSGLIPEQQPPERLVEIAAQADVIFASTLPRAIETAEAVAAGKDILRDDVFIEAPMPPPKLWGKRGPTHWGIWARISWYVGIRPGAESRQQAELRAEAAVATLAARALRGENVLLCGHGWFNRMMRPVLVEQGWRCVEDHGDAYWTYRRYTRRKAPPRPIPPETSQPGA